MSYEYDTDLKPLWSERAPQFVNLGIPKEEVDRLVAVVDDLYADRPGGWCYEWSQLAKKDADAGNALLAFTAYGGARFPVLADEQKALAHQHELEQYLLAAKDFPVTFDRQIVTTKFHGAVVEVPVHILSAPDATKDTPVLVVTGGVDTWKMDLHKMWVFYALNAKVRVVAADHPGTGELTHVPMTADSTDVIDQVVAFARTLTTGKVGQLGMSFWRPLLGPCRSVCGRRRRRRRRGPGVERVRPRKRRQHPLWHEGHRRQRFGLHRGAHFRAGRPGPGTVRNGRPICQAKQLPHVRDQR
jgi:esterase FrsA